MSSTHTRFRTSSPHTIAHTPLLALGQSKFFSEQQKPNTDGLWFMRISFLKSPLKNLFQNSTNLLRWFCNNIYWTPMWVLAFSPSSVIFTVNGQTKRDSILRKDNASLKISFHILFKELFFQYIWVIVRYLLQIWLPKISLPFLLSTNPTYWEKGQAEGKKLQGRSNGSSVTYEMSSSLSHPDK